MMLSRRGTATTRARLVAGGCALALTLGLGQGAIAAPAPAEQSPSTAASIAALQTARAQGFAWDGGQVDSAVVDKFDRYVTYSPATGFVLSVPTAVAAADRKGVKAARKMVASANAGMAKLTGTVTVETATGSYQVNRTGTVSPMAKHGGFSSHWWGVELWLDEWATGRLMAGLAAGSGASWVAAELTSWTGIGGLSAGAIAAILAFGAGAIWVCDWNNRGVSFKYTYIAGGFWCWGR